MPVTKSQELKRQATGTLLLGIHNLLQSIGWTVGKAVSSEDGMTAKEKKWVEAMSRRIGEDAELVRKFAWRLKGQ